MIVEIKFYTLVSEKISANDDDILLDALECPRNLVLETDLWM
jgi:hypothetical protein